MVTDLAEMREAVMAGTLKKEEGSEDLPGERATRSAVDGFVAELEIPLMNKFLNSRTTIIQETADTAVCKWSAGIQSYKDYGKAGGNAAGGRREARDARC